MATQLAAVRLRGRDVSYLDTSALFPLAFVEGAKHGLPQPERQERDRASALAAFFKRAQSLGARVVTTPLALEELAARVRNRAREGVAKKHGMGWAKLRETDQNLARSLDKQPWTEMLNMLAWASAALAAHSVALDLPPVPAGASEPYAEAIRLDHHSLLKLHADIDAMDALHIAFGARLGATGFISFDKAWRSVSSIEVYYA